MTDEYVTMPERCATCAFREGTQANLSELTQIKIRRCMDTAEPFYCHEDPHGIALCRGFVDALDARLKKGLPGGSQRDVFMTINETLAEMETRLNAGEKPESLVDFFNEIFNSKMKGIDIVAR
jgi:hypothetical protein